MAASLLLLLLHALNVVAVKVVVAAVKVVVVAVKVVVVAVKVAVLGSSEASIMGYQTQE